MFNVYENLAKLCKARGLTPSGLCVKCGLSKTIVARLKANPEANISAATAKVFADYLGVPVDLIQHGLTENKKAPSISDEAMKFAKIYDALGGEDKTAVSDLIKLLEAKGLKPATKIIPLFGQSLAAGSGEQDLGGVFYDDYEVPADSEADFACRVHGDSLEPYFHDGDIALALKRQPEPGEVGAFYVDGEYKLKQYCADNLGNVYLFAANRDKADTDQTLWANEEHVLSCIGTIIMQRIPLP